MLYIHISSDDIKAAMALPSPSFPLRARGTAQKSLLLIATCFKSDCDNNIIISVCIYMLGLLFLILWPHGNVGTDKNSNLAAIRPHPY